MQYKAPTNRKSITISLPLPIIEKMKERAKEQGYTISTFILLCIKQELDKSI